MWCVSHGRHVRPNGDNCDLNMVTVLGKPEGACVGYVLLVVQLLYCSDTWIPVWWPSYCSVHIP
jgi:hypothetical protein